MNRKKVVSLLLDVRAHFPAIGFGLGVVLLAAHPLLWLINTWFDPAYDSQGLWAAVLAVILFVWSVLSPVRTLPRSASLAPGTHAPALVLLVATSLLRAVGQGLAINIVAAASLVVDVYALGLLFRLAYRKRVVAPGGLACVFVFALPLERALQRCVGYGLQHASAMGAGALLQSFLEDVSVQGVRILIQGTDVLVDLPCSGARGLLNLLLLYVVLMALRRPGLLMGLAGTGVALLGAYLANVLRISLLSLGLAFPEIFGGIDVMASPWHDALGLVSLLVGSVPVFLFARCVRPHIKNPTRFVFVLSRKKQSVAAVCFVLCAVGILFLPQKPVDVSYASAPLSPPGYLHGETGTVVPLLPKEKAYFELYGGGAAKTQYGPYLVTLVRTTAPLRHLHNPDECMRGLGYTVTPMGVRYEPLPTATYRAVDPRGKAWRVSVSFVSQNTVATNVSEAVWHWLQKSRAEWLAVQRVTPWDMDISQLKSWDVALGTALDIPLNRHNKI